jgi:site-specific DNA-methyltransferase (cytosine-N4-specific)
LVVDIFSGSNTTGRAAEDLGRRWLSIDERRDYAALSAIRFLPDDPVLIAEQVKAMEDGGFIDLSAGALKNTQVESARPNASKPRTKMAQAELQGALRLDS